MGIKALLLDLDGTLVDSLPDIVRSVNELRRARGFTGTNRSLCLAHIGRGAEYLLKGCVPGLHSQEDVLRAVSEYQNVYSSGPKRSKLFAGVQKGLKTVTDLCPDLKLAVVTNKSTRLAKEAMAEFLKDLHFADIRGPEMVEARKPDARHALGVLQALQVSPSEALILGDDPVDFELAKNAGCAFLGAGWGYGKLAEVPEAAPFICKDFKEFVERFLYFQKFLKRH